MKKHEVKFPRLLFWPYPQLGMDDDEKHTKKGLVNLLLMSSFKYMKDQ